MRLLTSQNHCLVLKPDTDSGDHVFIRVHSEKIHAAHPIYNTRTINRRAGNKIQDTFAVPAPEIRPKMFEAVMRVAVERYPLILRGPTIKKNQRERHKRIADSHVSYVMKSGINTLQKYGFADVVEQSGLEAQLKEQHKVQTERSGRDAENSRSVKMKKRSHSVKDRSTRVQGETATAPLILPPNL